MKRKMFATAVVLVVMAAPLFGAQAASPAKPAPQKGGVAKPTADKAKEKAQTPAKPAPPAAVAAKKASTPPAVAPASVKSSAPSGGAVVKPAIVTLGPVQEKLRASKELTADVQAKLPGVDVIEAAAGFTDLHLFVSAAYVSNNIGIKFDSLKPKLLNSKRPNLRQAIQELRPASSAAVEAQRAWYDAAGAINAAEHAAKAAQTAETAKSDKPAKTVPKPKASAPQL
jgi:hypothetical protein